MSGSREENGLRFECTQCGQCCTRRGRYAHVYLEEVDVDRIAAYLGLSRGRFARRYTFVDEYGWRQVRFPDRACPFLDQESFRCQIYPVRPRQCRTFPFWPELISGNRWTIEARRLCEGVGRGRRYSSEEVERLLAEARREED